MKVNVVISILYDLFVEDARLSNNRFMNIINHV